MITLVQFLDRLAFGLAAAMWLAASPKVTCGFFQKHLWVAMGLCCLGAAVLFGLPDGKTGERAAEPWLVTAAAVLSYVGSVVWLYDKRTVGKVLLVGVAVLTLCSAWQLQGVVRPGAESPAGKALAQAGWLGDAVQWADPLTSGLLLGATIGAMFLGHWYLNTPTMALAPLRGLVAFIGVSIVLRSLVCGLGLWLTWRHVGPPGGTQISFLAMRWLAGLAGNAVAAAMTWETLKIPNTQSATGILYVGVIVVFLGELASLLLSQSAPFPL